MGRIRIGAGTLKGRKILVPAAPGLRPTPDRAREALFDILGQDLSGLRVLDAFAGSGALGFEALSRGAERVVFLESDRACAAAIRDAARALGVEGRCAVVVGRAEREIAGGVQGGPFDLVLADPPYADSAAREEFVLAVARAREAVPQGARVAVERESRVPPVPSPPGLRHTRTARYGRTSFDFYLAVQKS